MAFIEKQLYATADWEAILGAQIKQLRMGASLDQIELARRADISVGSIKALEGGRGCNLKTMIKVLRVLNKESWLETLAPQPTISPMNMLRKKPRQRVYKPRSTALIQPNTSGDT